MDTITFLKTFDGLETVEFNPKWKNNTGYLDNAVYDSAIEKPVQFVDNFNRRGILAPFKKKGQTHNIVVFQRYSDSLECLVCNGFYNLGTSKLHAYELDIIAQMITTGKVTRSTIQNGMNDNSIWANELYSEEGSYFHPNARTARVVEELETMGVEVI